MRSLDPLGLRPQSVRLRGLGEENLPILGRSVIAQKVEMDSGGAARAGPTEAALEPDGERPAGQRALRAARAVELGARRGGGLLGIARRRRELHRFNRAARKE